MANKEAKKYRRPSLFINALNRLTAFVYSIFTRGRVGHMLASTDTLCKRSFLASVFSEKVEKRNSTRSKQHGGNPLQRSRVTVILTFLRVFLSALKLNVYGVFFVFYGLFRIVVYYLSILLNGFSQSDQYTLICSLIIMLCSTPLLFSSQSAAQAISNSRVMRNIIVDFLCIPEEKLKVKKQYGGTVYVFTSAVLAMALGFATYFIHPLYVPAIIGVLILLFVIFSNPESGIILTLAATPFLQYFDHSKEFLLVMIITVGISYLCKILQKRRTLSLSPEISMIILFCGFIFVGGLFSAGGYETFRESVSAIIIILGGFLLTYNLISSKKMLSVSVKTLTVSFMIIALIGIWDSFYNGISDRITDTVVGQNIVSITQPDMLFIADRGVVFGMFTILILPLILAYLTKCKTVQSACAAVVLVIITAISAWMCSHYEIIITLIVEFLIFWLLYSHKSLSFMLASSVPIGIMVILYPYAIKYWYWPDISSVLMEYMPANVADNGMHNEVAKSVISMLTDGNLMGIGVGEHAFKSVYPIYSTTVSASADHPMSMWLQILCWSGVFGAVSFVIFVGFMVKRSLGYLIDPYKKDLRGAVLALFCGLMGLLIFGLVYSVWTDMRILYLFWVCTGLLMSYIRLGRDSAEQRKARFSDKNDSSDTELIYY